MSFDSGQLVRLKNTDPYQMPLLTVDSVKDDSVLCVWLSKNGIEKISFAAADLMLIVRAFWQRIAGSQVTRDGNLIERWSWWEVTEAGDYLPGPHREFSKDGQMPDHGVAVVTPMVDPATLTWRPTTLPDVWKTMDGK